MSPLGVLVGVGVGPGDPELLTAKAARVLREADRVFAPSVAVDAVGRAESIVRQGVPGLGVERLVFPMNGDATAPGGAFGSAATRLAECLAGGERVAFVTLGDPNIYSTFSSLAGAVRARCPGVVVETVPGITAFQDLASRAGTVLLDGTERLSLVTALDGPSALDDALHDPGRAVVVYKGGRHVPAIARSLARAGRLEGAVLGELLGLPGERVVRASEAGEGPATYLATVIVPPAGRGDAR